MLAAEYIVELTARPEAQSSFSHNIFLVFKKQDGVSEQSIINQQYAGMTREQRLEKLRASARVVSDLRGLNACLKAAPVICLPTFESEATLYSNCVASTLDLCSCFYSMKYDEESIPLMQFVFDSRVYAYSSLCMGAICSPGKTHYLLSQVYSKAAFDEYMANTPDSSGELRQASYFRNFSRYADDIGICAKRTGSAGGYWLLYHLWTYILQQSSKYRISLSAAKITIGKWEISLLGFTINLKNNSYQLFLILL